MKRKSFLAFCKASIGKEEIREVNDCLKSGWLTMGGKVQAFEADFAKYINVKHALSVNSCTAALHLALMAHDIGPGDEVLVPSHTFVSTVNVILHVGAKPVFVDIKRDSLNIDPEDIKKKISKKTKAIIVVHYAGLPVELSLISKIAKERNIIIIEDAAHAVGSKYKNKFIGSFGNTTCFSFYATKTMTTGEGGMLTTNNSKIADFVARNRLHGISKDSWKRYSKDGNWRYDVLTPGLKCNMMDIQAAIGIHQLGKLESFIERRSKIVEMYDLAFSRNLGITCIKSPRNVRNSYHLYPIILEHFNRDEFINKMKDFNIGTSVHFIPVHQFSFYQDTFPCKTSDMTITKEVSQKIVSLPLYPSMSDRDVNYVIKTVNKIVELKK